MAKELITYKDVEIYQADQIVLHDVNVTVHEGEMIYLLQHLVHMVLHQVLILPSGSAQHEEQVLFDRAVGEQFIILEDDTEASAQVR